MERSREYETFIKDLMPGESEAELAEAFENFDQYIVFLMRLAERLEQADLDRIRINQDRGV